MPTKTFSLPQELLDRLNRNQELGRGWRINQSKICQLALEQKLDEVDAAYKKYQALKERLYSKTQVFWPDRGTIESLKQLVLELEELETKRGENK